MRSEAESLKLAYDLVATEGHKITPPMAFNQMEEVLSDDRKFLPMLKFLLCMAMVEFQAQDMRNIPVGEMTASAREAARSLAIHYYARQDALEERAESGRSN